MNFEDKLLDLLEKDNISIEDILQNLEPIKDNKTKIKEFLPILLDISKEKFGEIFSYQILKELSDEKHKIKFLNEEIINNFLEIFKDKKDLNNYLEAFKKEIKKDLWKYLDLIVMLLNFKKEDKVLFNKKIGIIEEIDFGSKYFKIKLENGELLSLHFILAPEKIELINVEDKKEKDRYFENPDLFLKLLKEEKDGFCYETFKIKAKEFFGEDFEEWYSTLKEKIGFIVFKKNKQFIKFFKNFEDLYKFKLDFELCEFLELIEKNLDNLKVFERDILKFLEKNINVNDLSNYLNSERIKIKLKKSSYINFQEILKNFSIQEIYKKLKTISEKESFINEIQDENSLSNLLNEEEELKLIDKIFKKFESKDLVEKMIFSTHKNPSIFIYFLKSIDKDDKFKKIAFDNKKFILIKIINAMVDNSFLKLRNDLYDIWQKSKSISEMIKNLGEEIEEVVQIIKDKEEEKDFPYNGIKTKLESFFPSLFKEKSEEFFCLKKSKLKKEEELNKFIKEIPQVRKMITQAKELGDLRENFEYKSARERYEFLQNLIMKLKKELERARVIKKEEINTEKISPGTKVLLKNKDGKDKTIHILGPWESDPENNIFSYETDVIKNIIGKKIEEEILFLEENYEIEKIEISDLID